jgi:hypothetical protein
MKRRNKCEEDIKRLQEQQRTERQEYEAKVQKLVQDISRQDA